MKTTSITYNFGFTPVQLIFFGNEEYGANNLPQMVTRGNTVLAQFEVPMLEVLDGFDFICSHVVREARLLIPGHRDDVYKSFASHMFQAMTAKELESR